MKCNKCGNEIKDEEKYCGECSKYTCTINKGVSNTIKISFNKFLVIISIILFMSIALGVYFSYQQNNNFINNNSKKASNWQYNENGEITNGTLILDIGDYINYNHIQCASIEQYISAEYKNGIGEQKFTTTNYKSGWRVFGVENGKLMIISEDEIAPVSGYVHKTDSEDDKPRFALANYAGYGFAIQELNNICKLYGQGNGAIDARSITVEDINKITDYVPRSETSGYVYDVIEDTKLDKNSIQYELLFDQKHY